MYFISKNRKMMSYFEQESNKNLALVTSYRIRIDDHGDPINDVQSTQRLYSEDTQLNGIFLGDWMLRVGQNIIGEPTTTLFRKSFLTEPFGTLKEENTLVALIWHHGFLCFLKEMQYTFLNL